jgi:excisionase family DNA binding protein
MNNPFEQLPQAALTFEQVPAAMTQIWNKLENMEKLLMHTRQESAPADIDQFFNLDELCKYHPDKPAKPTVYGWVHRRLIPYHKDGKTLRFLKSEIDLYLKGGRRKTQAETAEEADEYVRRKRL